MRLLNRCWNKYKNSLTAQLILDLINPTITKVVVNCMGLVKIVETLIR
jgi:hypothetical protein